MAKDEVRIDKFMWATRIFKTRTIATEACKKGRVMLDGVAVKPSRMIKVGDVIQVRKPPVTYSFRVLALSENRMGAKLVPGYLENITPPEQYELLEMVRIGGFVNRQKGLGRPTKRDGRQMKQFLESEYADDGRIGDSGMYFPLGKVEYLNFLKKKGPYNSSEIISLTFVCKIKSYVGEKTENTVRLFGRLSGCFFDGDSSSPS